MGGWWGPGSAKDQFLRELHQRVGHPFPLSFDEPFAFDAGGTRWRNIDQLEAVVEFYVNFAEPWSGLAPKKPGDNGYITISLRDPKGENARIAAGNVVELDGDPDLSEVIPDPANNPPAGGAAGGASPGGSPPRRRFLYDTLSLETDRGRPSSQAYRVMQVDNQRKTLTLDARPDCPGDRSKWRLNRRPILVAIDPLGARVRSVAAAAGAATIVLAGDAATVAGADPQDPGRTIVRLDGTQSLERINPGFDTIHLPSDRVIDAQRPGRVYRIAAVRPAPREVSVVGAPNLEGASSRWEIPAGVSGALPTMFYDIGPAPVGPAPANAVQLARGFDHYDGALFIVWRDRVAKRLYRWSSYTSRVYGDWSGADWQEKLSSLRGNARYHYSSFYSDNSFRNYTFAVVDAVRGGGDPNEPFEPVTNDTVAQAGYYFGTPSPPAAPQPGGANALEPRFRLDGNGKRRIRFHLGNVQGTLGNNSAGCLVSPQYFGLRTDLVELFEYDYQAYYGWEAFDAEVRKLLSATRRTASQHTWTAVTPDPVPPVPPAWYEPGLEGLPHLPPAEWVNKLVGWFWLIRPDQLPLEP